MGVLRGQIAIVGCGLDYLALYVVVDDVCAAEGASMERSRVFTAGRFCREYPHELAEAQQLRGVPLRHLACGSFHCCAVATRGQLYTFGSRVGLDMSNGNLLGTGDYHQVMNDEHDENVDSDNASDGEGSDSDGPDNPGFMPHATHRQPPRLVAGIGPVVSVSCSTYSTVAITVDGQVFSWGDCDGDALGHTRRSCHEPHLI